MATKAKKITEAPKAAGRVIDVEPSATEPKMEVVIGAIVGKGNEARQEIKVNDWTLTRYGEEGEMLFEDLLVARKLGYEEPRMIRKLIKRMVSQGRLPGEVLQRSTVERYESKPGIWQERAVESYHLTRKQALKVATQSKTDKADAITNEMIDVYDAAQRGLLQPVAQASPANDDIKNLTSTVAQLAQVVSMFVALQANAAMPPTPARPVAAVQLPQEEMRPEKQPAQQELIPKKWYWLNDVTRMTRLSGEQVMDICYSLRLYQNSPHLRRMESPRNSAKKSWQYDDYAVDMIREMAIRKGLYR